MIVDLMEAAAKSAQNCADENGYIDKYSLGFYTGVVMAYGFAAQDVAALVRSRELIELIEALPKKVAA